MLTTLLTAKNDFPSAMQSVRAAYLDGQYIASCKAIDLPFGSLFIKHFEKKMDESKPLDDENRKWGGNLNHMCNVVGAMAHVLRYAEKNMPELGKFTPLRRLHLLHLAFYHDIGKTIIPRRHAIEGKVLFQEPKASVQWRFEQIFKAYGMDMPPETLPYYALLIGAHDVFGTISTGENGLLSLGGIINRLRALQIDVHEAVCDLWLLNLADILCSVRQINGKNINKWEPLGWVKHASGELEGDIGWYLDSCKGQYLRSDLAFALQIADGADANALAQQQAACRFQRLARQTLGDSLENGEKILRDDLACAIIARLESPALLLQIHDILRSEFGDHYPAMFGGMLQFDYALGFFQQLAGRAVYWLGEEDGGACFRTGWLYKRKKPKENATDYEIDYMNKFNAECVVNNYMMVLAGIFGEIHRITSDIEQWNIEFEDAKARLSEPKCDRLLGFDGPFRAGNARHLLLRELMLYKA